MTLTETIITDRIPLRHRGKYFAWASIMGAVETVSGPLIDGVLSQRDAWRWIFLLNLPIVFIGFTGVILFLKLSLKQRSLIEKLLEIDYLGSFIFISSLTFSSCLYHGGRSNASMVFMAGTILQNRITSIAPCPSSLSLEALILITKISTIPASSPETTIFKHAFADSIRMVWAVMCGIAGFALIASAGFRANSLDREFSGEQGAVDGGKGSGSEDEEVVMNAPVVVVGRRWEFRSWGV
ncbi:uncharacterized protein PAC_14462 [Phialocephala subalpina]|uniref:Major facilitator superfamily (MFS) profile domain-containing protein n=1 Tax=Phialocephala subalpina TaxID=576137 RepID=A0A1L7XHR5_9HELO|nr:uncharacterized protein PAC_14462 [Phialocephala subalpina]